MEQETNDLIKSEIENNDVCLFMKGTPDAPQCGFSMATSNILKVLEVNIFNFKKNLYNKKLTVEFLKFIRGEKKFNGIDELKKQIKKDVKTAKELK